MRDTFTAEGNRPHSETFPDLLWAAAAELSRQFDWENGGFGSAPKFPPAHELLFLLEYARRTEDSGALEMAEITLTKMAQGDIFDREGGGFFRYSACGDWQSPYPEKALSDNALLACAYLEAYAQTGLPLFGETARRTLDYALRRLRLPGGGFACTHAAGSLWRDEAVLTAWNAMMISALVKADRVLGEEKYLRAAREAHVFLKTRLTKPDGRLWLRWRDEEPDIDGQLDDYAFYCLALIGLYEAEFAPEYLQEAVGLADRMAELDWDKAPSNGWAAALALGRLARLTGLERFRWLADGQLAWLTEEIRDCPAAHCSALLAILEAACPGRELVCVSADRVPQWLASAGENYRLAILAKTPEYSQALADLSPRTAGYPIPEAGQRYYFGACDAVETLVELREMMRERELVAQ